MTAHVAGLPGAADTTQMPTPNRCSATDGPPIRPGDPDPEKQSVRRRLLAARRGRDPVRSSEENERLTALLHSTPELARLGRGSTVAGYSPLAGEPSPDALLCALADAGVRVLLPVLRPDRDLDWRVAGPAVASERAGSDGGTLGLTAVTRADVVLLPGVAGDRAGRRLGRGGGSYDRVLARLAVGGTSPNAASQDAAGQGAVRPWTCLLVWPEELLARVPAQDHDRPVDAVATATGLVRAPSAGHRPPS